MRHPPDTLSRPSAGLDGRAQPGLFREELLGTEPARTVSNLFSDLKRLNRGEIIAEHPERHLQGTRLLVDPSHGHGFCELYRLDQDLYVVAVDGVYDVARVETVPGEGLVEFCIRLTGDLQLSIPGGGDTVRVRGPRLLVWYQPPDVTITESLKPKMRESCICLYCKPEFLEGLVRRNGISHWPLLEQIQNHYASTPFYRLLDLSPTLLYVAKSLLESPYRRGIRLLHAEAKALELLCEVLAQAQEPQGMTAWPPSSEGESRRLDEARHLLRTRLSAPPRLPEIARTIGMSESKLKRTFKSRFGATVFDYGLECRMRHALELLRGRRMSVGQVAYTVGYRHPTSFTAAFFQFFGFLPSKARTDMH
jgi:AraC family transcriptional regulator, transcriptional activator of the genes for pyochelin and ferripyochelin receptors